MAYRIVAEIIIYYPVTNILGWKGFSLFGHYAAARWILQQTLFGVSTRGRVGLGI
ncbi:MAG TPA: hypothetical protein VFQ47_06915 [Nitrososphaera sp.]|nr:hypothetical protein [Nitrososphaera sp.]